MPESEQSGVSPGIVYVEQVQPHEYVVYRPGTLDVGQTFPTREDAIAFARAEWPDFPVILVRESLIFTGAPYVEAS
jgi:hypothetical protein